MGAFETWFDLMVSVEGGVLSTDPTDGGNYTPAGVLKGSRYGLSARNYPNVDFDTLTKDMAAAIARRDYWNAHALDTLPPPFAILLADAYYNGASHPVEWLQNAVGATADDVLGPLTIAAAKTVAAGPNVADALGEFAARHLAYHATLDRPPEELGWARRDVIILLAAIRLGGGVTGFTLDSESANFPEPGSPGVRNTEGESP